MYIYINAIKFKDDIEYLQRIVKQLSNSVHIPYEEYLNQLIVDDLVADLDFASMYLHIMITMNISKETIVDIDLTDPDLNIIYNNETIIAKFKPHHNKEENIGLMPVMSLRLLQDRTEAK